MKIHYELPPETDPETDIAIDIEMFDLPDGKVHDPRYGKFACITFCMDGENVYYVEDEKQIPDALERVKWGQWIMHNGSFDITHLRRWALIPARLQPNMNYWDTMHIERIIWGGFFELVGLNHLVRRYLDIFMEKETREQFKKATKMNAERIEYACLDALYTYQVKSKQARKVDPFVFEEVWTKTDLPDFWAFLDIKPVLIDVEEWIAIEQRHRHDLEEQKKWFDFNPSSWQQTKKRLSELGWNVPNTQDKTLAKFIRQDPDSPAAETAQRTTLFRKKKKLVSTYGLNWIENHIDENGEVRASWDINRAETGRSACSNPNMMNIPVRNNPEYRKTIIAHPGYKLGVYDYGQQEPRISAFLSQDKNLIKVFKQKGDVYINTAYLRWGEKIDKKDERRRKIKDVFLGIGYGLSPFGLAENWGVDVEEAEAFIADFWNLFPEWDRFLGSLKWTKNYSETVIGRRIWLNPHSGQRFRNAMNNPIQGTAADMKKRAIAEIWKKWNFDTDCFFGLILDIHDELVFEQKEQHIGKVGMFVQSKMIQVAEDMCPGIPFVVDGTICDNWLESK